MQMFGISAVIEKIHAVFKVHDTRIKKLELSICENRYVRDLETELAQALERIKALERNIVVQSPQIFDDLLEDSLTQSLKLFFGKHTFWQLQMSDDRSDLIDFMHKLKTYTNNTIYGYLVHWSSGSTTVGYVGESCDKQDASRRPRVILGDLKCIEAHNATGESMLLHSLQKNSDAVDKITYFVACNTGSFIEKEATKKMESELYQVLNGEDGKRVLPTGDVVSIDEGINWLYQYPKIDPKNMLSSSMKRSYADNIHQQRGGGREHSLREFKESWKNFGKSTGFFL